MFSLPALFALFQWGLKKIPHMEPKTANIMGFVLSLGSVLMIRGDVISELFSIYGTAIVLFLGLFIPLLLFWVIHKGFQGNTTADRFVRAGLYIIIGYALMAFSTYVTKIGGVVTL